ncbi:uncharacterized protein K444DRAFT_662148 [Hyaloscypha bicolor E]|uniref:Uncharacterized protein n=1 Tax=Hyaloscypha bicolor E TaxID=1095630 RepID=A0A2J6TG66_9HELO|nr:uncharacterized protein K444DRAFT_662148 [Hyaloscypha bicolor E]PMD61990.1 hypothetical protein K444DRAFT_662148 [Hyaloscypha bicolor E]
MSFNKLAVSAVNGALEIQPALANINFDFSLWKVAPPKEFEGVGAALTTFRRNEAENGCAHRTARKLGALFEKVLPTTPKLIKAYGQRASEISKASSIDAEARAAYGVFASRVGADATSLWAAATSGSSAIAVHLLACMLAKIWEAPEATSIWVEITEKRKKEINDDFEQNNISDMASLAAAKQELTRSQISEWDASARAWLGVADTEKCRQQKQLMLILENVQTSVNKIPETYSSVISAWKNALIQMEGLINGVSQEAQGGDIILGLSAWHLFPDLMVVAPRPTPVRQRDPIFAHGGVLTIGLVNPNTQDRGVHWSLPLAHLRHYGVPVVSLRSIDSNERSRISTGELLLATFGCVLQGWGEAGNNTLQAVTWLNNVGRLLEKSRSAGGRSACILLEGDAALSWFSLLLAAARQYLESQGNERKTANKLILLGRKHGKRFLDRPAEPLFGLLGVPSTVRPDNSQGNPSTHKPEARPTDIVAGISSESSMLLSRVGQRGSYVNLITADDDKIHFLRMVALNIAGGMSLDPTQIFIRYKRHYPKWSKHVYEYTTALPWHRATPKRKFDESKSGADGHTRWLYRGGSLLRRGTDRRYYDRLDATFPETGDLQRIPGDFWEFHKSKNSSVRPGTDRNIFTEEEGQSICQEFENRKRFYASLGEHTIDRESELIEDFDSMRMGVFWDNMGCVGGNQGQTPWYRLIYGDENSAGLFVVEGRGNMLALIRSNGTEAADFSSLFEAGKIDATAISNQLLRTFHNANAAVDPHLKALKAVSTAAAMYRKFPNTSVDVRILQQPIWKAAWVKECYDAPPEQDMDRIPSSLEPYHLERSTAFACIAMFESGIYDIDPSLLENVIAMSSIDSIYIGGALLLDPQELAYSGDIRRVLGNIGRPGMAFLIPPVDPMIREVKMAEWSRIDRDEFDGDMRDCFESTSLHLSFTGANTPINLGFSGGQDVDVYLLETLISLRDGGEWIADLDIFNTIDNVRLRKMSDCQDHNHNNVVAPHNFTAIDNWFGLIDAPETPMSIVRAHKNWQARLAATTISIALGYETVVLSDHPCWCCFNNKAKEMAWGKFLKVIIIG